MGLESNERLARVCHRGRQGLRVLLPIHRELGQPCLARGRGRAELARGMVRVRVRLVRVRVRVRVKVRVRVGLGQD